MEAGLTGRVDKPGEDRKRGLQSFDLKTRWKAKTGKEENCKTDLNVPH